MALIGPKLLGGCNQDHPLAVSNEDGALARRDKDGAILAVIDVEVGSDVEDEETAILAIFNVVLLLLNRVYNLDLEGGGLLDEAVIIRVVFLLHSFGS